MVSIAVGAKRYDGGSGSAVFTGVIPLKPGQLLEADLATVSLWEGAQELGCSAAALWPQHPDGSMKVVKISATLSLAAGVQKDLELRIGAPRTKQGPAQPLITDAWMKAPRLIGGTDPAHLCASRVAPLPLVPIPSPHLPDSWNTFLTTEWDDPLTSYPSWGRMKSTVMADKPQAFWGAANYNFLTAVYCKYLTSGELDRLNEAHHLAQYGSHEGGSGFPRSVEECTYGSSMARAEYRPGLNKVVFYGEDYDGHTKGSLFNANPDGWTDRVGAQPITGSEWNSGVDTDFYLCYALSGWEQVLGTFLCRALSSFGINKGPFPDTPLDNLANPTNQPGLGYGGRFQWRLRRGCDILLTLLTPPMALFFNYVYWQGKTIPSPRTSRDQFLTWARREHLDFYDWYSNQYVDGHWLKGSWWSKPGWFPASSSVPQGLPLFQLGCLFFDVMLYYLHIDKDPRVPAQIVRSASMLRQLVRGPEPVGKHGPGYKLLYAIPNSYTNNPTDAAPVTPSTEGFWGNTILLPLYALAYRVTGDLWYRDLADLHASNTRMAIAAGSRAGFSTFKEAGECYSNAFFAAAWRAGVPLDGWELEAGGPDLTPPAPATGLKLSNIEVL